MRHLRGLLLRLPPRFGRTDLICQPQWRSDFWGHRVVTEPPLGVEPASHSAVSPCRPSKFRALFLQCSITVKQRRSPCARIPQSLRQAGIIGPVDKSPGIQFAPVRGNPFDELSVLQPAPNDFQHVCALAPALSQGPAQQRFEQSSASLERLKVNETHPRQTKSTAVQSIKDRVRR